MANANSERQRKSAVFVGCARDCEDSIDLVLANMRMAATLFTDIAFVFVENDSADGTAARLQTFGDAVALVKLQRLPDLHARHPLRTERLAAARNCYLDVIRESALAQYEYLFVFDMDGVNAAPQASPEPIRRALEFLEIAADHAAVFANQLGYYYDCFALRHPTLCPRDPWEEVFDYVAAHGVSDLAAFEQTYVKRMFAIDPASSTIEVDSAFGGLGIYKMPFVLQSRYLGIQPKACVVQGRTRRLLWQVCEHVSFHAAIRAAGGRLFIAPWLVNAQVAPDALSQCNPSAFRGMYQVLE